jgi:hypothetical protein
MRNNKKKQDDQNPALTRQLHKLLDGYALAATAAGVAALALAVPAEGSPICKTVSVNLFHSSTNPINPALQRIPPFNLAQTTYTYYPITTGVYLMWWNRGLVVPNTAGAKLLLGSQSLPANLAAGASIGPGGNFGKGASSGLIFTYGRGTFNDQANGTLNKHRGNFNLRQSNYVGFEFMLSGELHYGWARINVKLKPQERFNSSIEVSETQLLGYGYESAANTAVAAGACSGDAAQSAKPVAAVQPDIDPLSASRGSLSILALGSLGLPLIR